MGPEKEVEKVTKLTITAKEATERLAMAGIRIGYEKLRAALKQGKLLSDSQSTWKPAMPNL